MSFEWSDGNWKYANNSDIILKMKDEDGTEHHLNSLQVSDAKRMLGVYIAAIGNTNTQAEQLRDKAIKRRSRIRAGFWIDMMLG